MWRIAGYDAVVDVPRHRPAAMRDWTLQTKTNLMPEPEINELQRQTDPGLDKVTILSNPTRRRRRKPAKPSNLSEEEIDRLFRAIGSVRDRAIFRLAYHAGLRASEIGMLEYRDYNGRTDRLMVTRLKGSNSGEHHLCREESRSLKAWLKIRGTAPGTLFPSQRRVGISRKMLDVLMKRYAAAAGIPEKLRHFHVLKHSCATHLLSRGYHVDQVQDWIGHANIQNTMIYAKVTNSRREQMGAELRDAWK